MQNRNYEFFTPIQSEKGVNEYTGYWNYEFKNNMMLHLTLSSHMPDITRQKDIALPVEHRGSLNGLSLLCSQMGCTAQPTEQCWLVPPIIKNANFTSLIFSLTRAGINSDGALSWAKCSERLGERLNEKSHLIYKLDGSRSKDYTTCNDWKTKGQRCKTIFYCKTYTHHPGPHSDTCYEK